MTSANEMGAVKRNTQTAPWPADLEKLVAGCKYRPGWRVMLDDEDRGNGNCGGLTLTIWAKVPDTYNTDRIITIRHLFIVPAATYDYQSWRRWLLDRFLDVEKHECMESFQIDGVRPYAPNHGPGNDPYIIFEEGTVQQKRTNYLGDKRDQDAPLPGRP